MQDVLIVDSGSHTKELMVRGTLLGRVEIVVRDLSWDGENETALS